MPSHGYAVSVQAGLAGCIPGGTLLPGSVLLKSVCLDQAEVFHYMVLVVHQGWSLSTAVPKPENSSPAGGGLLCCSPQFDRAGLWGGKDLVHPIPVLPLVTVWQAGSGQTGVDSSDTHKLGSCSQFDS